MTLAVGEQQAMPIQLIEVPDNTTLPAFVYGFLKPGELAHSIIEAYVEHAVPARVTGSLRVRDGLPLLVADSGSVEGFLLLPKGNLYEAISSFEPRAQYRWSETTTLDGTVANVLLGRSPQKGSAPLDASCFSSRKDILLVYGPRSVRGAMRRLFGGDEVAKFFEVQMAYMLLWSIIERFISLRYGPWLEPLDKVRRFGSDPLWASGFAAITDRIESDEKVVDSRDPGSVYCLDAAKPERSLLYFYQFRCNLVHRGKAAMVETVRLERAANQLMDCIEAVWGTSGIEWKGESEELGGTAR